MNKFITAALFVALVSPSLYGMKRARPTNFSLEPIAKREHVDTSSSMFSDKQRRAMIFCGLKVHMDYEYTMPRDDLNQFQKNFVDHGITGNDEKGILLQKYYLAFMNNIRAGSQANIGGPKKYVNNGEIYFQ